MEAIEDAVWKLEAIAKKNNDVFRYSIEVEPHRSGVDYTFEVKERADGHAIIAGTGKDIESAVAMAMKDLQEACREWGYKQ